MVDEGDARIAAEAMAVATSAAAAAAGAAPERERPAPRGGWQGLVHTAVLDEERFVRLLVSYGKQADPAAWRRVLVRPVQLKGGRRWQFSYFDATRDITKNFDRAEAAERLEEALARQFLRLEAQTRDETLTVERTHRGGFRVRRQPTDEPRDPDLANYSTKDVPLPAGRPDPVLQRLGVMDEQGRVRPRMHAKFAQVNEFLKLLEQSGALEQITHRPLTIVDCGCGAAFLTFAAAHFLSDLRGIPTRIEGVDLREALIARGNETGAMLGSDCAFTAGAIAAYTPSQPVDIVVALHACDTATDEALAQAIRWQAPLLLSAPCCHHHLQAQMHTVAPFRPVFRHGIHKERLGDILTDTFRALILQIMGYTTDVVQFVSAEHTDRNILIRAVRNPAPADPIYAKDYAELTAFWGVTPYLETLLGDDFTRTAGLTR